MDGGGINFQSSKGIGSKFWVFVKNSSESVPLEALSNNFSTPIIELDRKSVFDHRGCMINFYGRLPGHANRHQTTLID